MGDFRSWTVLTAPAQEIMWENIGWADVDWQRHELHITLPLDTPEIVSDGIRVVSEHLPSDLSGVPVSRGVRAGYRNTPERWFPTGTRFTVHDADSPQATIARFTVGG